MLRLYLPFFTIIIQPPPLGVVLKMKTGVLACGVPSGWEVSLVDNPGFGENNEYVDQVANGAVGSSAAYIFLTTMACIGGKSNAQFYKHLKSVDISKFGSKLLVIVGIIFAGTHFGP